MITSVSGIKFRKTIFRLPGNAQAIARHCALIASCLFAITQPVRAADAPMKTLRGHVPATVARLSATGVLAATQRLTLAIGLPLRDERGPDDFIARVYNPADPNYRHYLSPEEFTEKFGPTAAQYAAVVAFAARNQLTVTATHGNRLLLDVNGSVADIQRAFHLNLRTYRHPVEAREFYAPDAEPTVDAELPVVDISGLNNFVLPHPASRKTGAAFALPNATPRNGSGTGGSYLGKDFRNAYLPGVTLSGAGQMLGLVEFDGYYPADITAYETKAGLPAVPLQTVLLDGFNGVPTTGTTSGNDEVSLDIEMAVSMVPGIDKIILFEGTLQNDILNAMAASNQVRQFSCSWGWAGGPSTTTDSIFKQMAAQGQSFFAASGDNDAFTSGQADDPTQGFAPSSCAYITIVGGTTLTTGAGGSWTSETVWNQGAGVGSSGGVSSYYSIPFWQIGMNMTANGGSTSQRNFPDVAMVADNVYVLYGNGGGTTLGGTSCATPLWAGIAALINQQAALSGVAPVGFLNPAIYALGKSANYKSSFHDIVIGNNVSTSSPGAFHALPGYDLCTGWGTPVGQSLINLLAGPPDGLGITPIDGFTANGPVGGPFSPISATVMLTNSGSASLTWSLLATPAWLNGFPNAGVLAPGEIGKVALSFTANTGELEAGNYVALVTFSNLNSHVSQELPFTLRIAQSLVQNGGFETGQFTGWNLVGDTANNTNIYNAVGNTADFPASVHSGNYGAFLGDTKLATLTQTLTTVPGANYLLSFWLDNPTNGTPQEFLVTWVNAGPATHALYVLTSPPVLSWTNPQFLVTAAGTSTLLQFRAENGPFGFGLDDVSVTPIPSPDFQSVAQTTNGVWTLAWRAATGLTYQVQYKTNLLQADWIDLGTPMVAAKSLLTVSDSGTGTNSAQRFYRLVVSP